MASVQAKILKATKKQAMYFFIMLYTEERKEEQKERKQRKGTLFKCLVVVALEH